MSPCFFTCISLPNGAKSVLTIRGGGELERILTSLQQENPGIEIVWK
jgi:hypothetical protein